MAIDNLSCPDCENGIMHKVKLGAVPNFFKCSSCQFELLISKKIIRYLDRPSLKFSSSPKKTSISYKQTSPKPIPQ